MHADLPPRFPVLTGIVAGLWILHGVIHTVVFAISFSDQNQSLFFCCTPFTSLFLLSGILTILGRMRLKFMVETLGLFVGFAEIGMSMSFAQQISPMGGLLSGIAGFILLMASIISIFDIDSYDRWVLVRERWQREHADE